MSTDRAPALPRELTSLSAEVSAVGAPPALHLADPWAARLAHANQHAGLLSEWMNRQHLAEAWEYAWPPEQWHRHLQAQLIGEYSRPFIVAFRGEDILYLEVYRAAKDSIAPRYAAEPHDLGIHAAIGDLRHVNQGVGRTLLPRLTATLFEGDPQCRRILFDPDHRNIAARRACERADCEFLGEHNMTNRRMALYALHRQADH